MKSLWHRITERIRARLSWELAAAEGADYMYVSNLDVRDWGDKR